MCSHGTRCWISTARPGLMYSTPMPEPPASCAMPERKRLLRHDAANLRPEHITSESAYKLAKMIYDMPRVIADAGEKYEPSVLTRHIVDMAQAFNRFYHDEHILVDDMEERVSKLILVRAAKQAIKNGLSLLGMEAPERM